MDELLLLLRLLDLPGVTFSCVGFSKIDIIYVPESGNGSIEDRYLTRYYATIYVDNTVLHFCVIRNGVARETVRSFDLGEPGIGEESLVAAIWYVLDESRFHELAHIAFDGFGTQYDK